MKLMIKQEREKDRQVGGRLGIGEAAHRKFNR
jgi:hypothetical protein